MRQLLGITVSDNCIGEETKNPKKTIPLAIVLTLFNVTVAYSSVASVLTLMWPYYDQVHSFFKGLIIHAPRRPQ